MNSSQRTLVLSALAIVLAGQSAYAKTTTKAKPATTKEAAAKPAPAAETAAKPAAEPAKELHPVAKAVAAKGVSKCTGRVNQVSNFLTNNKQYGGTLFVSPENPDQRLLSTSLEMQAQNSMQYAGMTYAPGEQNGKCSATFETVTYWNNSCRDVATKLYPSFQQGKPLNKQIEALDGGPSVRVFLMAAGQGCVAIKKEMAF